MKKRLPIFLLLAAMLTGLLCGCGTEPADDIFAPKSWQDFAGCSFAVVTGSISPEILDSNDAIPKDITFVYGQNDVDNITAVLSGKADAMSADLPVAELAVNTYPELVIYDEAVAPDDYGFLLQKDSPLTAKVNEALAKLKAEGVMDMLREKWFAQDNDEQVIAEPDWDGSNGTLIVGLGSASMPMTYVRNGKPAGYEAELVYLVARELNMKVKVELSNFDAVMAGITSGKYDIGASCISITEERKEVLDMSDVIYEGASVVVYKGNASAADDEGFFAGILASLERTFVREDRWKMFLSGILTTLFITVMSIVLGTALGFFTYFVCKDGNRIANRIAGFCIWLVEGIPMVVLLMILYYVVFGKTSLSGSWVSIIGFTLTFGCSVFGMVKGGVNAVDGGQMEAALAMGYGKNRAFCRMILPQALKHIVEPFKGAVVQHIKATSIVGYIAVQDLTKMSDLVRSRTYEAFFPLIATAIFYFIMAGILTTVIKGIQINLDPGKKKSRLLKEVNRK